MNFHHYHHLGAEEMNALFAIKQGLFSGNEKLDKMLEALNSMSEKLQNQEKQLKNVIEEIKSGLFSAQNRIDGIIKTLETKNDTTTEIDLTDELAALQTVSSGINEMFKSSSEQASGGAAGGGEASGGASASEVTHDPETVIENNTASTAENKTADLLATDVDSARDQLRTPVREPVDNALVSSMEEKPVAQPASEVFTDQPGESDPSDGGRRLVNG
jgi:methyl-accepting chemotaxis protein